MTVPKRKQTKVLKPEWFRDVAKIAMKRGTSIIFTQDRQVFGIAPKSGGSVTIRFRADEDWVNAVLERYPEGAVFPCDDIYGGPNIAKMLRPYANITLPDEGGEAYIHPVTGILHMKGKTVKIHAAGFVGHGANLEPFPSDLEQVDFSKTVPKEIGKLLVECSRRDDNRPNLRRIYGIVLNDKAYLGSADGRSALMHGCEKVPKGFSYDPALVSLYDIVEYGREVNAETNAVTHHYLLSDGTRLSEKNNCDEIPPIAYAISQALGNEKTKMMGSLCLGILIDELSSLGLGSLDQIGGTLAFEGSTVTMLCGNENAAEFTVPLDTVVDDRIMFALLLMARMAKLHADMYVCDKGAPAIVSAGDTHFVAMPVTIPSNKEGAGK